MTENRTPRDLDPARRQLHRRVKRGIVASYIHELSERHNEAALAADGATAPALEIVEAEEQAA